MNKSETRLFLEEQFDKFEKETLASADEQSPEEVVEELLEDEFLKAPLSYKKEYVETFKSLPPEMRKYLHERESEIEKGFSKLNNELQIKRFFDDAFETKGSKHGFKDAKDWIEKLIFVEDMLEKSPRDTLCYLAKAYGIDFGARGNGSNQQNVNVSEYRYAELAKELKSLREEFVDRERKNLELWANAKAAQKAKDASFSLKGRTTPASVDFNEMTTRQILERKFADLED